MTITGFFKYTGGDFPIRTEDIARIESEAGIIATLVYHPEYCFYSEGLLPNHFFNQENKYIYTAICRLAQRGVARVDAFSIIESLKSQESTAPFAEALTIEQINDVIDNSEILARHTLDDYKLCVDNVMDAAFRRDTLQSLKQCESLCFNESVPNIEQRIYQTLDDVMMEFSAATEVPAYRDVIDGCWEEIKGRQGGGYAGIPFPFPALNDYATIERGELFILALSKSRARA